MKLYLACAGIILIVVVLGYNLLLPMSAALARYMLWRLTPAAKAWRGCVTNGDARIHFVSYGSGPAVLLLHGGLSHRLSWFSQIPWLVASGRQVVLLDVRGHGASELGSRELNYRLLASDAVLVLTDLGLRQADVIGWSDGGNTALLLGRYWPEHARRMVVVSANFSPTGLTPDALADTHKRSNRPELWLKRWWTGAGERLNELEQRIKHMWHTFPMLQTDDLQAITAPVLVMVGEHDLTSIEHAKQMAELLPQGSLKILTGGGHSTPVTHSNQINEAVAAFLDIPPP